MSASHRDRLRDPGHGRIFRNSLLVAGGQGSVALLFVVYVLAARVLGAAGFGDFTLGLTIATLLVALPAWGTNRYASIHAARDPQRTADILSTSVGLTVLLAVAYLPLVWLTGALVTPREVVAWVALLLGIDMLAREYALLLRLLLRVHDAFAVDMLTVFAERGLMILGAAAVLLGAPDPLLLAAALAGGRVAGAAVTTVLYVRKVGRFSVRFRLEALRDLWSGGTPIAVRRAIGSLSFRVDTVFLGVMRTATEVGWYGAVYALMDGVVMLPGIVTGSLGPTLSANFGEGRRDVVIRLYRRGLKYLLTIGIFVAAVFATLADFVIAVLYGSEYAPAATALRILSVAVVFIFVRRHATDVLDNVDRRSVTAWIFGVGLLMNVVLNLVLIPRFGYLGAAASTVLTEGCLMTTMVWALHSSGYGGSFLPMLRPAALAIVPPAFIMGSLAETPIVAALTGGAVYLAALTVLGGWDEKDRRLARDVLARVRAWTGRVIG